MNSGDIVIFSGQGFVSKLIRAVSGPYSHVGMIVRAEGLDQVQLWESTTLSDLSDLITGKRIKGVQCVLMSDRVKTYVGKIFLRSLIDPLTPQQVSFLALARKQLHGIPYEKKRWELVRSVADRLWHSHAERVDSLFCSEFVVEVYQRMGLLNDPPIGTPSNEYLPTDFSPHGMVDESLLSNRLGPLVRLIP